MRQSWEMSATGRISLADNFGAQYDWFQPLCLSKDISVSARLSSRFGDVLLK